MPMTFERSKDTEAVVTILHGVNDEISYSSLARQADLSVKRVKAVLASARRILLSGNVMFGVLRGQGLRRLDALGKKACAPARKKKLARGAARALKESYSITPVEFETLANIMQLEVTTDRLIFNIIRSQAMTKTIVPKEPFAPPVVPDIASIVRMKA